jgi:AcrR family transcriptional regulator
VASKRSPSTQDRLLDAVTDVAASQGYRGLTVQRVLDAARVSRATFYQYFSNLDDCFWSAYRRHADQLAIDVAAAARDRPDSELAALQALIAAAISRPSVALLLMREGLAAGRAGLLERDALVSKLEHAMAAKPPHRSTLDLPSAILIGATFTFLSMRLSDESEVTGVSDDAGEWALAFTRQPAQPSWWARFVPPAESEPSRSRWRSSGMRLRGTPRERILRATAATIREKGYRDSTVADIVSAADVSRRTFYNEFPGKAHAFIATYEHGFHQTLAACTPAFFSQRVWEERVWHGAQAFTRFMAREPLIAYLGFVECYAVGPEFASRVHDIQLAFTLFLEEGYRQSADAQSLSRSRSALTAATIFELAFQSTRRGPGVGLRRLQPLAVYIALAPFIGADEAGDFVVAKLSAQPDADAPAAA